MSLLLAMTWQLPLFLEPCIGAPAPAAQGGFATARGPFTLWRMMANRLKSPANHRRTNADAAQISRRIRSAAA